MIMVNDDHHNKRMFILEKIQPRGFKLVEVEREVINTLIEVDLKILQMNYDLDSHRLCLEYLNNEGKKCVKVIPFE